MKHESHVAAAAAVAIAASLNPHTSANNGEVVASTLPLPARHHEHIETEAVELGVVARAERELRPVARRPFANHNILTNPIERRWQPESFVLGTPLPLLAELGAG